MEDTHDFGEGFGGFVGTVVTGDNDFGIDAFEVTTGVGDDAIAAFLKGAFAAAIADDAVAANPRGGFKFVERMEEGIVWGEVVDAAEAQAFDGLKGFFSEGIGIQCDEVSGNAEEGFGKADEPLDEPGREAGGEGAAAMGNGDIDDAFDVGPGFPLEAVDEQLAVFGIETQLFGADGEGAFPEFVVGGGDERFAEQSAHAVGNDHAVAHGGIMLTGVEVAAELIEVATENFG